MPLAPETRAYLEQLVRENPVLVFMKGTRDAPQCGFSMTVVRLLDQLIPDYETVDVLADPAVRQGIKEFSDWPTIPQLYVGGEFLGGCDIVREMYGSGELHEALGLRRPSPEAPRITVSDAAAEAFRNAQKNADFEDLRVSIDARFHYALGFGPEETGDRVVESAGFRLRLDPESASRADGMRIDVKAGPRGPELAIENPNEPRIGAMTPQQLQELRESGQAFELIDVRTVEEREQARIEGARLLDQELYDELCKLPKDALLVFHCHSGMRSAQAAQRFAELGFRRVFNLEGGIDAWSREVDPSVPRY